MAQRKNTIIKPLNQSKMEHTTTETFKIAETPPVGGYRFGNASSYYTQINLNYKPKWIHRQFMKIFFGLYWFNL
jgi:hypothetical protein